MKKTIFSKAIAILGRSPCSSAWPHAGKAIAPKTATDGNDLTKVTFMLSWAPDTNHIGVYVAKNKGYFKQAGLDVDIVAVAQAGAAGREQRHGGFRAVQPHQRRHLHA